MEELLKSYLKNKEDINKYHKEIWRLNSDEPQAGTSDLSGTIYR